MAPEVVADWATDDALSGLDGVDATRAIRGREVTAAVSQIAANPAVRSVLVERQRGWVEHHHGGVVEGRDIGTVVFPDADVKVFLTASVDERARRRAAQLRRELGEDVDEESVRKDVERRDRFGQEREVAPLKVADDAVVVDTTDMELADVVARLRALVESRTS